MKQLLLLFLLLLSGNFAFAQHRRDPLISNYDREILQILRKQNSAGELKPTALKQRVIAQSNIYGINHDSTSFKYSGMRGSRFDFNSYNYARVLENVMEPDAFSLLADSILFYQQETLSYVDYAYYRPDNKTDSIFAIFLHGFYELDSMKEINEYNSDGVARQTYYFAYDPVTNDTNTIIQYNYDATHLKKITDTVWGKESGSWFFGSTTQYHYDAFGNLDTLTQWGHISGTLTMTGRSIFTYYPDGKLRTRLRSDYFNETSFTSTLDTFGYTSGLDYCTWWQTVRTTDHGNGPAVQYRLHLKYPGVNGNPDSTKLFTKATPNDNWTLQSVYRYTYNDYNNPEEILVFQSGNNTGIPDQRSRFYYEIYDNGLSINEDKNGLDITAYPNPFNDRIDVDCKSLLNQNCTFRLFNAVGIEVFYVRAAVRDGKVTLSFPRLSDGFYTLLIPTPDGRLLKNKMIRK